LNNKNQNYGTANTNSGGHQLQPEAKNNQTGSSAASKTRKNGIGIVLKSNATQLALKDDDKAGSRVPGGQAFIPNNA
jgi:hypothetical protein